MTLVASASGYRTPRAFSSQPSVAAMSLWPSAESVIDPYLQHRAKPDWRRPKARVRHIQVPIRPDRDPRGEKQAVDDDRLRARRIDAHDLTSHRRRVACRRHRLEHVQPTAPIPRRAG